ncbi:hypothetical protein E4U26_006692 [Claviceps purpurea]|nr:hypothetical protein E4U26_006692 [Claviceps purpurea]
MASLLRQIVAGPRARHAEAGLDLCYVTDFIIATSGPSQTYPQLAYRNPLDQLVAFLDAKHGDNWAIWEFRAEGTGYPDEAVYGRVRHYPWPDHHPPPFRLVPIIMAGMRNWLHGGALPDSKQTPSTSHHPTPETTSLAASEERDSPPSCSSSRGATTTARDEKRVVVVHCKAGKGRSGTMATSYLVSEEGWTPEDALARFTAQRMRPKFGAGVSIPSQLRWVSYVDRWTKHGKKYLDRPIEIVEIHVWGLRHGVKVDVSGFADNGKKIQALHTFSKQERHVVQGGMPKDTSIGDMLWELAGYGTSAVGIAADKAPEGVEGDLAKASNLDNEEENSGGTGTGTAAPAAERRRHKYIRKGTALIQKVSVSANGAAASESAKTKPSSNGTTTTTTDTTTTAAAASTSTSKDQASTTTTTTTEGDSSTAPSSPAEDPEPGGQAVIFRPVTPILVPTSDIHIGLERRNKTHKSLSSLTMVSAMAHVWFNAFFEGQGPEQDGRPSESGVFSIEWHAMDGIKGSSRKGSQALDRMSVVWRAVGSGKGEGEGEGGREGEGEMILEPAEGEPVPQLEAADWRGVEGEELGLGLRVGGESSGSVDGGCGDDGGKGVGNGKGVGIGTGTDDGDGHAAPTAVVAVDGKATERVQ